MSHSEEHIRVHAKLVDFVCEDLSKKRKLEEQLSIPVSKYKFRTKLCDSERVSPLVGCTSEVTDSYRCLDCVTQPGTVGAVSEVVSVNGSTVLASHIGKLDKNPDLKISDNSRDSISRETGEENVMLSSFVSCAKSSKSSLQFSLVPMDERSVVYSTGHSRVSKSSKTINCETSCSCNQLCSCPVDQSCNAPGNQSCSSPDSSTTFGVGLEFSEHSIHYLGRKAAKKRTPTDFNHLHVNLQDCNHIEDKLHIHQAYLEDNQFNRLLSREGTVRGEENVVDLLTIDGAEIDSVESIVSAYKTAKVKRHKSVNTASCTREFESGSTTDRHTRHCREEAQLLASGDTNSSVKTSNSQNYVVCHPQSISSTYGHVEASIASTTEIDEELDANTEPYSERQNLNINIMGDTDKTLPLYVLSSGRASRKEEVRRDSKPSTIDQDFEQYFSMLML